MRLSDDEREELVQTARRFLGERYPIETVRRLAEDPSGHDATLTASMYELGWGASHLAEEYGGYGLGLGDTHEILAEMGRALASGPIVTSAVIAAGTLSAGANTSLAAAVIPEVADGSRLVAVAVAGSSGHASSNGLTVTAESSATGFRLSGSAHFVLDAHLADQAVVFARSDSGVVVALVDLAAPGITLTPTPLVDITRRASTVTFESVNVESDRLLCEPAEGAGLLERCVDLGAACAAIDSFGVGEVVLQRTTEYVLQRHQFGRPIGSFQVIKHRLADAVLGVETSRVAVADAAEAVSPVGGADRIARMIAVSTAKSYVGDHMVQLCQDAIQSHGGIGFTWEHDMHLYFKRVLLNQSLYGSSRWHRVRIAELALAGAR